MAAFVCVYRLSLLPGLNATLYSSLCCPTCVCGVRHLRRDDITRSRSTVTIEGKVDIAGNTAGYEGGAIYSEATLLRIPAEANLSDNTALIVSGGGECVNYVSASDVRIIYLWQVFAEVSLGRRSPPAQGSCVSGSCSCRTE